MTLLTFDIDAYRLAHEKVASNLSEAIARHGNRQANLHEAEVSLRDERDVILREFAADPSPLGKNEAAREAAIRGRTMNAQRDVDKCESHCIAARTALEMAKLTYDCSKTYLRLGEMATEALHAE